MPGTVNAIIPLSLLEAVRSVDIPEGDDIDVEYVQEHRNKRLGLSDTVIAQIRRYKEAQAQSADRDRRSERHRPAYRTQARRGGDLHARRWHSRQSHVPDDLRHAATDHPPAAGISRAAARVPPGEESGKQVPRRFGAASWLVDRGRHQGIRDLPVGAQRNRMPLL